MASNIRTGYLFAASWVAMVGGFATTAHAAVTISTSPTLNMSCTSGVCTPTAATAVLNVNDLTTLLASGSVTVNTGTGSLAPQVEDIVVASTFNWASANGLTLDAYRSVTVTAAVAVNGTAPVSLVTNDGGSGGNLLFVSGGSLSFLGTTNKLSINGQKYKLAPSIAKLAADIKEKHSGFYALSASYDARRDGTYSTAPIASLSQPLIGALNGLGNTITNLTIDVTKRNQVVGLIADVGTGGSVRSLRLADVSIMANESDVGAIAGLNGGLIFNVFATGTVALTGKKTGGPIGGLVGGNFGGTIEFCQASVSVTGPGGPAATGSAVGGLVGINNGPISQSFATGTISGGSFGFVGGFVGYATGGAVTNSYATGTATAGPSTDVGGLVGVNENPNGGEATVSTSYSIGAPTGGSGAVVGGLIGVDNFPGNQVSDDWDTTTSGIANLSQGAGSPANDPGITGLTTTQLQSGLPAGFDPTIWAESPSINNGLPYLIANPPQ